MRRTASSVAPILPRAPSPSRASRTSPDKDGMATARPVLVQARGAEVTPRRLTLNLGSVDARIGAPVPAEHSKTTLTRLGFEVTEPDAEAAAHLGTSRIWDVLVPTWRGDCTREVDLIEEVARHYGLMKIARTVPASRRAAGLTAAQTTERQLKALLSGLGYREVLQLNFVSSAKCDPSSGPLVKIANPLSVEQDALRTSLVMPGLLEALERNQRHGVRNIQFFETRPHVRAFARRSDRNAASRPAALGDDAARVGGKIKGRSISSTSRRRSKTSSAGIRAAP